MESVKQCIKSNLLECLEFFFLSFCLTLFNKLTGKFFIRYGIEEVAAHRNIVKTHNFNRNRRTCRIYLFALAVNHRSYLTYGCTCNDNITCIESTVLYKKCCNRTSALIKLCFNNNTLCGSVRISFKLTHFCNKVDGFKKFVDTHLCFSRNRNADNIAAPFFRNKLVLCELLHNSVRICTLFIHLVDGNNNFYTCCLCVIDSLNSLRHNTVICGNNKNGNIRAHCTSCTHCGKCGVTRCVKESNNLFIRSYYLISTDSLCNTAGFG